MKELKTVEPSEMANVQTIDVQALLVKGMESNTNIETMERLFDLSRKVKEDQAKQAFLTAMSLFQSKCPIIRKDKKVMNKDGKTVRYAYATLDSIIEQTKELMEQCGLSFSFKAEVQESGVIQHCEINHVLGHKEVSSFGIPIDPNGFMGDAQKAGSASSYAKRYAFCNGFGILTGDQDDDGQSLGGGKTEQDLYRMFKGHMDAVMDNIESVLAIKQGIMEDDLETASAAWFELPQDVMASLWIAVTKGSCFTSHEKEVLKSREFRIAHYGEPKE